MYSILIKVGEKTYNYATIKDQEEQEIIFTGNVEQTKQMYSDLLEKFPSSKLVIVHNTTITSTFTITDVAE